jgi:hypothetical protein
MAKINVPHPSAAGRETFIAFIGTLKSEFPGWKFSTPGTLKTRKGSVHYHINSNIPKETGTIELTWDPAMPGMIEAKLSSNREGNWAKKASLLLFHRLRS